MVQPTNKFLFEWGIILLFVVFSLCLTRPAESIAVYPVPEGGRVSSSRDKNLVLLKAGWRIIDPNKQFEHGRPPRPFDDKHTRPDSTIVVLIASLRETRLKDTLVSMISNAKYPERIRFAIVQQNAPEDDDIVVEYCKAMGKPVQLDPTTFKPVNEAHGCPYVENIRVLRMPSSEARGPAYARALGNKLVDFELDDFCMQIDAHTKVVQDWDVLMLQEWGKAENEYGILTTYPTNVNDLGKNTGGHWEMPHLCCASGSHGVMVNCQAKAAANLEYPLLAPLWAAGLSFSKCHAEKLVPNDPNLKGVFAGEEYARGVRLWTHGYDFYSSSRPWVGTYYGGDKGSKSFHWKTDSLQEAHKRMATLVRDPSADLSPEALEKLKPYDLGQKRTLEQYIEFTGIDPRGGNRKQDAKCAVAYVPWYKPTEGPALSSAGLRGSVKNSDFSSKLDAELTYRGKIVLGILLLVVAVFSLTLLISRSAVCGKRGRQD